LLDEEDAVERMDGWMEGKSTRKDAEDDFLLRTKKFRSTTKKGAKSN
jgi:hypothetical protein